MKKRKKLSGFTLIELIIVMAIFSGICVGALAMVRPAMQLFHKTSAQEEAGANIDNISRYLQDNLRYADRLNIYQYYSKDSTAVQTPADMMSLTIPKILPYVDLDTDDPTNKTYKKMYMDATPLEFFQKYYFNSAGSYDGKNVNIMQIDNLGKISIYTCSLENGTISSKVSAISDKFYDTHTFSITNWEFSPPNLKINLDIKYNGVTKDNSGKTTQLTQQSVIALTFLNIANRSELDVFKEATLPTDSVFLQETTDPDNFSLKNNTITSRPASAFKNFSCEEKLEDGTPNPNYDANGYTYIVYTVPEIIIP